LRIVAPEAPGVKARVSGAIYRGGHFRVEANVQASPELMLHLSLPEPCAVAPGATINVAVDDGWIIPEPDKG
jgi:iron(III) transport system ATP-binding protein